MPTKPSSGNDPLLRNVTRRQLFERGGFGLGAAALGSLLADQQPVQAGDQPLAPRPPHYPPRAKAVIFLFMAGGPSQLDLFNDKPMLREHHGSLPPESYLEGKRFAFLKGTETLL